MSIRLNGGYLRIDLGTGLLRIDPTTDDFTILIQWKKIGNWSDYDPFVALAVDYTANRTGFETYNDGISGATGAFQASRDGSSLGLSGIALSTGNWMATAFRRPAGASVTDMRFYAGDQSALTEYIGIATSHSTPFRYIIIGELAQPGLGITPFNGEVARIRVWKGLRSNAELLAEMPSSTPVISTALLYSCQLLTTSDNTDQSGNSLTWVSSGTVQNGASDPPSGGGSDTTITPSSGSLTLTGQAPAITRDALKPGTGTLTLTGQAPVITSQLSRSPGSASLGISGSIPTIQILGTIRPNTGTLTLAGNVPSVIQAHVRTPLHATLTIVGLVPTVNGSRTMQPGTGSLSITGNLAGQTLTVPPPAAAQLTIAGQTPNVFISLGKIPASGSLVLTGRTPVVSQAFVIQPSAGTLLFTGYAPGSAGVTVRPTNASLTITGQTPFVQGALTIAPGKGTLTITGIAPALTGANIVRPNPAALAFTGTAPNLATGIGRVPASGTLTLGGVAPIVRVPMFVTPASGALQIFGQLSPSAGTGGGDGTDGGSGLVQRRAARYGVRRPIRLPLRAM